MDQFKTMLSVKKMMSTNIFTADSNFSITKVAEEMSSNKTDCILIVDGKTDVVGVITEGDIVRKIVAKGLNPSNILAKELMSGPIIEIKSDESIFDAKKIMGQHNVHHLIVKEDGKLVGIIAARDLAK